jgi:hypothetical protein
VVPRISSRVDEWVEKVAEIVRPDPPMTIRTLDGVVLTGPLVCDAGHVIVFIGTRIPPSNGFTSPRHDSRDSHRYEDGAIARSIRKLAAGHGNLPALKAMLAKPPVSPSLPDSTTEPRSDAEQRAAWVVCRRP